MLEIKITIGICVKNSEKTIRKTLLSIVCQSYPHNLLEIIVVDGGSRDRTLSIIRNVEMDIPLKLFSDEGRGLGIARQIVVNNAIGEYIIFVDSDAELLFDFVQKQVEFLENNPKIGIAFGRYLFREEETGIATLQNLFNGIVDWVGNDATVYRMKSLGETNGFDRRIKGAGEDLDIIIRFRKKGWLVRMNPEAGFYHSPRKNWRELWMEQQWFGYGFHLLTHKHRWEFPIWRKLPILTLISTFLIIIKSYRQFQQKRVFLIPLLFFLMKIPWWIGFTRSHIDDYGHYNSFQKN
jgi:glycosyltransferase involved in cell wall biosynthesis